MKSKVIFFIRPMHGHVNPSLELVNELVNRGEEVFYYTTEVFQERIEAAGAVCRFYANSGQRLKSGPNPGQVENQGGGLEEQLNLVLGNLSAHMEDVNIQEQELYEEVKAENPDYIIYDYMDGFWGKMLAKKLGIPAIASIPTFAICERCVDIDPEGSLKYILHVSPQDPIFKTDTIRAKELIAFISARIGAIYNIKHFNMLNYGSSELLNIVYTSRLFQPHGELFDDTFKFVGFDLSIREETVDFPYEQLNNKPLIFISLGTNYNRRIDFYKMCMQAFRNVEQQVVLSVGSKIDLKELGNIPGNFIVRRYVPQLEILKRSGLFITHGGLNSVREGIFYQTPLMVFPQQGDQYAVAGQVSRLGAGICFENGGISAKELEQAARQLYCNETIRRNCQEIKKSFLQTGGAKRAVDEIFKIKEKIGIR